MSECNFSRSRLDGANLSYANLERADLRKARIVKIQLTGTKLNNCIIDISQMRQIGLKNIFTLMGVAIWGGTFALEYKLLRKN